MVDVSLDFLETVETTAPRGRKQWIRALLLSLAMWVFILLGLAGLWLKVSG